MPSRSIIRTGVGPHREPGNRFPAMAAAINLLAARAARVQSRRNLSRSLSPKLDHSHSITRFDRSRTGPKSVGGEQRFGQYGLMPGRQTMASDRPQALQDTFLDHVRKHEVPVTIFLASGIKLQGSVREFDSYSLLLVRGRQAQLIYKRAVSTIMPGEPVRMPQTSDH